MNLLKWITKKIRRKAQQDILEFICKEGYYPLSGTTRFSQQPQGRSLSVDNVIDQYSVTGKEKG